MTEDEERRKLLARVAVYTDIDMSGETLESLRGLAETYDIGARLTRHKGRLGAVCYGDLEQELAALPLDREK